MAFISAQLLPANSISPSSSSARPQQTPLQGLGLDPREVKDPQGFSEEFSAAPWSRPTSSAGSRLWQSEPLKEAPAGGQGRSGSLGLGGACSPFQQSCFCLSWLLFPFHQLHPGNARLRGGKGAGASEVLLQGPVRQKWCQDSCCHKVRLGL